MALTTLGIQAQRLSAVFDYATFCTPKGDPYIETYISFDGRSLNFEKAANGKYIASVDILVVFKKNDSIINYSKHKVNSPAIASPADNNISFMDAQRFALDNGIYTMELTLKDNSKPDSLAEKIVEKDILVNFPKNKLSISNIQILESYVPTQKENMLSKHGYDFTPYMQAVIGKEISNLTYFTEIYNANTLVKENQPFILNIYLQDYLSGKKILNNEWQKVLKAKPINVVLSSLNIKELPSGNYYLIVEINDTANKSLAKSKVFFQRSNPAYDDLKTESQSFASIITNDSLLTIYVKALDPIANPDEQHYIRHNSEKSTLKEKQDFLDGFFIARYPETAEEEWQKYLEKINYVQANFGFRAKVPGYITDRGIVYLKYGAPNYIIDEKFKASDALRSQGSSYLPYQMWRYDVLPGEGSKKMFVFWQEQFTGADYRLLHSDVRGEPFDPYWETRLSRGTIKEGEIGAAGKQFERGY